MFQSVIPAAPLRRGALRAALVLALAVAGAGAGVVAGAPGSASAAGSSLAGESFTGSSVSDSRWLALGASCLTGATAAGSGTALGACMHTTDSPALGTTPGYLQLTDDSGSQSSSVLYNRALPSSAGVDVKFDTYQYGTHSSGADGIGFFLTDGSYTLSAAGPNGGSLGYTSRTDQTGSSGVAHGYLGVGLDVFGNNSNLPTYQGSGCTITSHLATPQSVVVRGPGNGAVGYCLLSTTRVSTVQAGATLDATATSIPASTLLAQSKRDVEITVSPTTPANPNPTVSTYIDFSGAGTNYQLISSVVVPSAAPATVKLGFSASTGGSQDVHLIRNVTVSTLNPVGDVTLAAQVDHSAQTGTSSTSFTTGSTVPFAFTVTATGANPLSNIQVTDPDITSITCPFTTLAVADSMTCTGSRVLTASDTTGSSYSTSATVTATDTSGTVTSSATATAATYRLAISAALSASPTTITAAGQQVVLTTTATNTGTAALSAVAAAVSAFTGTGAAPVFTCAATTLAAGASTPCTAAYTTTQADVEAGSISASTRATGSYNGTAVTSPAASATVAATSLPALTIAGTGTPTSVTAAGQAVAYSFVVTNSGNRALHGVAVPVDAFGGSGQTPTVSCPAGTLAPGAQETCIAAYTATQDDVDAGSVALTVHAAGTTSGGAAVASQPATVVEAAVHGPALGLTAAATPSVITAAGQSVGFGYTLTNSGNVTLHSAGIASTSFTGSGTAGTPACSPTTIPAGGTATCTVAYTATQADVEAGRVVAVAHATADDHGTAVVSPDRTATVTATQAAALTVAASRSPATFAAAGQQLAWSFSVTNGGNLALHGVTVPVSSFTGSGTLGAATCAVAVLAPGASTTCTIAYSATQADLDAGGVTLGAKAAALTGSGTAVTSSSATLTTVGVQVPALSLSAAATPAAVTAAGQQVQFQYTVTNAGDVTLGSIGIDQRGFTGSGTLADADCPAGSLTPGASVVCTARHTATQDDMTGDGFGVSATATADDRGTSIASSTQAIAVAVRLAPALALQQTVSSTKLQRVGAVLHFTELVTNTGDAPLTNVTVRTGAFTGSGAAPTPVCPSGTLSAGTSETCSADYTVTQADIDAGSVAATATVTGSAYGRSVVSAPSVATAVDAVAPALSIAVTSDTATATRVGQAIVYTFRVTNIGRVTAHDPGITGVTISGAGRLSAIRCPEADVLSPQQSMTCTATYQVQSADIGRSLVVSARASATGAHDVRTTTRSARAEVRVPASRVPDALAFTGAGPLGWGIAGSVLLAVLLGAGMLGAAIVRRRRAAR